MDEILGAFDLKRRELEDFASRVERLLRQLLTDRGDPFHAVNAEVKGRSSLERKVETHRPPYGSLREVTDALRARIITYFPDDVDRVGELIEEEFTIDRAHSHDPRKDIDPRSFGYLTLHYVVTLSPARGALPEWVLLAGWPFEIQIRTILQHAWAEIEHDRGYRKKNDVPADIRRRWSRVAALLETADTEFESLRGIAAKGAQDGQDRPSAPRPRMLPDAIASVAVGSAGLLVPGKVSASTISISIVLKPPAKTIKRTMTVALETPDVMFEGTPGIVSEPNIGARIESSGRVISIELGGDTGEPTAVFIHGLNLAAGTAALPGAVQASIAIDHGIRRPIASLGTIGLGPDLLVAVRAVPTLRAGGRNQVTGRISIVEAVAGSLMDDDVLRLRLVDMSDIGDRGGVFETAPLMVVRHGDVRLRDGAAPSATNVVSGTVHQDDASCAEWTIWTASTVASTLEVGAAGLTTGPLIAVGSSQSAVGLLVETVDGKGAVRVRSLAMLGLPIPDEYEPGG
ncbi:MAG: GTP pyrophosphokinase [Candidatus Limnocylindrales bacterium]